MIANPICKHIGKPTRAIAHELTLNQRFAKELTRPARLAHRALGIAHPQKTK
jgi:hypothetical protein